MERPSKVTCPICGRILSIDAEVCPGCGCIDAGARSKENLKYEKICKLLFEKNYDEEVKKAQEWVQNLGERRFIRGLDVCHSCGNSFWYRIKKGRPCIEVIGATRADFPFIEDGGKINAKSINIYLRCCRCGRQLVMKQSDVKEMIQKSRD